MNLDDEICYCYHVPLRKLLSFARRTRPVRASQMSECLGAGTGCGWCVPILQRIHDRILSEAGTAKDGGATNPPLPPLSTGGEVEGASGTQPTQTALDHSAQPNSSPESTIIDGLPTTAEAYAEARQKYIREKRPRHQFNDGGTTDIENSERPRQ